MTSALLFVAVLGLVDLSYRRWMRRSMARRMNATAERDAPGAAVIPMPAREQRAREREPSSERNARRSS